jgi:hypothetical protein
MPSRVTDARQNQKWGEAKSLSPIRIMKRYLEFEAQAELNPA